MYMFFWWDYTFKNFLFYNFNITSITGFVFTCLGILLVAIFFECLKMIHAKVKQKRMMMTQKQLRMICPSESDTLLTNNPGPSTSSAPTRLPTFVITRKDKIQNFVYDVGIWVCQNVLGYLLMLTIMLYNGYMAICIVIGSAIGYFLFGPTLMKINIESCRALRSTFCMADCGEPDKTALLAPGSLPEPSAGDTSPVVCHSTISETTEQVVVHT